MSVEQPFTDAEVELVAETIAADLGLEAWQVRRASAAALRTLAAARRTPTEAMVRHSSRPHAEPAVLAWDWREQPDIAYLARAVRDVSGGTVHVREVDTGSDQFAIVIAGSDLDEADTQAAYERWLRGDPPDTEEDTDAA